MKCVNHCKSFDMIHWFWKISLKQEQTKTYENVKHVLFWLQFKQQQQKKANLSNLNRKNFLHLKVLWFFFSDFTSKFSYRSDYKLPAPILQSHYILVTSCWFVFFCSVSSREPLVPDRNRVLGRRLWPWRKVWLLHPSVQDGQVDQESYRKDRRRRVDTNSEWIPVTSCFTCWWINDANKVCPK